MSMQEKLTRQGSSGRPDSDSLYMHSAFLWEHIGTKVRGPEFLQSSKEIATGGEPIRII